MQQVHHSKERGSGPEYYSQLLGVQDIGVSNKGEMRYLLLPVYDNLLDPGIPPI